MRRLAFATTTAALALGGCNAGGHAPAATAPAAGADRAEASRAAARPPAGPRRVRGSFDRHRGDPGATRVTGGPLLLRIAGTPKPTASAMALQVRYALIFRLSRGAQLRGPTYALPEGVPTSFGGYSLPEVPGAAWIDGERGIFTFGRAARHCLAGYVTVDPGTLEGADTAGALDALQVGSPVKVSLQPLTPRASGKLVPGYEHVAYPRLATADYALRSAAAQRRLMRIGCPAEGGDIAGT